jgi:uncharacterized protein (TIGR02246 family)
MKRALIRLLTYFVCTFGLSGAVLAANSDIRTVIEGLNSAWNKAFNSGNAAAVAALYDEKATLSPGNGKTLVGRAEIEKLFKSFIDNGVNKHSIQIIDARRKGDLAYEVARWSANGPEKDGKKQTFGGVLINVFQRGADGKWKSVSHVWNASTE